MPAPVAVLIATCDREDRLLTGAVPSALRQTVPPAGLLVVDDGHGLSAATRRALEELAAAHAVPLTLLQNGRCKGPAGAWNTGLAHLAARGHRGFVALLDDDDTWDDDHLEANLAHAEGATIVVSGLRMRIAGNIVSRPLIRHLDDRAFLTGNPGWQGSNTFASLRLLLAIGGFREGLASLHDRDLAIRLLRHPDAVWRLTDRWTATWNMDTPGNLSTPRSPAKREGLRAFWGLYGPEMHPEERAAFFSRAEALFGITATEIMEGRTDVLPRPSLLEALDR